MFNMNNHSGKNDEQLMLMSNRRMPVEKMHE